MSKKDKKETKINEEVESKDISKLNNDLKKFKIVLGGMATLMTVSLVGGGYLLYDKLSNDNDTETTADYETYTANLEKALENPSKVKAENIEKLVEKQKKGDYTLQTMIDVLGDNPSYITQNTYEITYEKSDVKKIIKNFMNKKSYKDSESLIELVWITEDGKSITTYLASDMTDKVNIVGLFVYDDALDNSKIQTNDKITKTKLTFEELADVDITLEELEDKVGTLYHYSVQYPLLKDSEIVKTNSSEEDIDSTIKQSVFKNETSSIVVYSRDNDVLSISDVPYEYKDVKSFDKDTVAKYKENEDLKEEEFNKTFEGAMFVAIEESSTKEGGICKTYLIKDSDDNVYSVGFENGTVSYFEQYNSSSETETTTDSE